MFRPDFIVKGWIEYFFPLEEDDQRGDYYDHYMRWDESLVKQFAYACLVEGIALPYIPCSEALGLDTETTSAYFVARNFEIPNRLLDFSKSPTIAAWFALSNGIDQDRFESTENIVVWFIRNNIVPQLGFDYVSTLWANAQIPQMQRQKSVLLVDSKGRDKFLETGKFQPMEYMLENYVRNNENTLNREPQIGRILLSHDQLPALQEKLEEFELSDIRLFPTMDRIARETMKSRARSNETLEHWRRWRAEQQNRTSDV